jgi:SAM-dependent methyltransferase
MKDNFSTDSGQYKKYRPTYPRELYEFLISIVADKKIALDCGTGNGQVAHKLSQYFETVYATDISILQIEKATKKQNIVYDIQAAEKTSFPDATFDLITVAQAIHWFNFNDFYREVERTLKKDGILAVFGYGLIKTFNEADKIIRRFYTEIVGPYWDIERKYIDDKYESIAFPFKKIEAPEFKIKLNWNFEHLINYLKTWSAVQHYKKDKGHDPIDIIYDDLKKCWGEEIKHPVEFPIFLMSGKR